LRRTGLRAVIGAAGLLALGFLVVMAFTGRAPGLRNLVVFAPRGLMIEAPARITRLELAADDRRAVFVRRPPTGWQSDSPGGPQLDATFPSRVDAGIEFMHVSAPVRTFSRDEYSPGDLAEFGLDPPRFTVTLLAGSKPVLRVEFGSWNPMKAAQYVRVRDREEVHLVPRFVGREWESIAASALAGTARPVTGEGR